MDFKSKSDPKTFLSLSCGLQVVADDDDDVLIERSEYDDDDVLIEISEYDDVLIERPEYVDDVSDRKIRM